MRQLRALIFSGIPVIALCALAAAVARCPAAARATTTHGAPQHNPTPRSDSTGGSGTTTTSHAIIISGASGGEQFRERFTGWTVDLVRAFTEKFNFPPTHVKVLAESAANGAARATAEEVKRAFESVRHALTPDSTVFIFFIGHGTFDGRQAKFNLVGPDLPATAYGELISSLPARRVVILNMASASGEFVKPLAAKGRIIITATRSGQEKNATRFATHFIDGLGNVAADADQNKRISVLEAFNYASRLTAEAYKDAGYLATEHALLEDNGDGVGHQTAEAGDGALARVTYFDSAPRTPSGAAPAATAKLLIERTRLEEEIEQLKTRKGQMPEADYEAELEKLLVGLARLNQTIRKADGGTPPPSSP